MLLLWFVLAYPVLVLIFWVLGISVRQHQLEFASFWMYGTFLVWLAYAARLYKLNIKLLFGRFPRRVRFLFTAIGFAVLLQIMSVGFTLLTLSALSYIAPSFTSRLLTSDTSNSVCTSTACGLGTIIITALIAPIVEEVMFRGIMLNRLWQKWGVRAALWVTAVVFGLLHGESLVALALFSITLSILYSKYKNLFLPIVIHILYNAMFLYTRGVGGAGDKPLTLSDVHGFLPVAIIIILIFGGGWLWWVVKNWPQRGRLSPYESNRQAILFTAAE